MCSLLWWPAEVSVYLVCPCSRQETLWFTALFRLSMKRLTAELRQTFLLFFYHFHFILFCQNLLLECVHLNCSNGKFFLISWWKKKSHVTLVDIWCHSCPPQAAMWLLLRHCSLESWIRLLITTLWTRRWSFPRVSQVRHEIRADVTMLVLNQVPLLDKKFTEWKEERKSSQSSYFGQFRNQETLTCSLWESREAENKILHHTSYKFFMVLSDVLWCLHRFCFIIQEGEKEQTFLEY